MSTISRDRLEQAVTEKLVDYDTARRALDRAKSALSSFDEIETMQGMLVFWSRLKVTGHADYIDDEGVSLDALIYRGRWHVKRHQDLLMKLEAL